MSLQRTMAPDQVGFDPARLARIDAHFARYVDDGRLAGWQLAVTRRGEVAHSSTYGLRDREAGTPVEPDTLWRIYSMTKPITSVAAMMLWEEGRFELTDEISRWLPEFAEVRVYDRGSVLAPVTVPATRTDPDLAPAHPHRRAHLRLHPDLGGRRALPGRRLRPAPAGRGRPGRGLRRPGQSCRCSSSPARVGATRSPPTYSAGWSRSSPGSPSTTSSPNASSARWA